MKSTVFRYGIYGALAILFFLSVHFFLIMPNAGYEVQEAFGYLTIFISMIFVFLGIRHYRNHFNGGFLSFGEGFKIGILIVLIPAVFFGLFDILYTEVINPSWSDDYYSHFAEKLKASTPPEKLDKALSELKSNKELFDNPVMSFLLMAATVLIIGIIVTIISALALMRRKKKPGLELGTK